jgi:membrane fusion protein (multidrug efflux system)
LRKFILTCLLASVGVAGIAQQGAPRPAVVAVPAEIRELAETNSFNGRLDANRRVALTARVAGVLEEVGFAPGARVEAGQRLFAIERALFEAALREAEGALRAAQAQRDLARIERDRQAELVAREAGAQARLEQAEAALATGRASTCPIPRSPRPLPGGSATPRSTRARLSARKPARWRCWSSLTRSMPNSPFRPPCCAISSNAPSGARFPRPLP